MLYRHGDILLARVATLPHQARPLTGTTLAAGEATGHRHRILNPNSARLWQVGTDTFVQITGAHALLVHEEHQPIELDHGVYRYWRQREYRPGANIDVED